ncbi:MAG: hypothetical protein AB7E13_04380 [Arcobacteraceae bacterium]
MRIHNTRHLLGNAMVNKGDSLEYIGENSGHSSTNVTNTKTSLNMENNVFNSYLVEELKDYDAI